MRPASPLQPCRLTLAGARRHEGDRRQGGVKDETVDTHRSGADRVFGGRCRRRDRRAVTCAAPAPDQGAPEAGRRRLEADVTVLEQGAATEEQCETVVPVARYGGFGGEGYVYAANNGNDLFMTSALDVVENTVGVDPDLFVWMLVADNSCVVSSSSSRAQANAYRPAATTHGLLAKKATEHR